MGIILCGENGNESIMYCAIAGRLGIEKCPNSEFLSQSRKPFRDDKACLIRISGNDTRRNIDEIVCFYDISFV